MQPIRCTFWERTDKPPVVTSREADGSPRIWSPVYRNIETGEELPVNSLPVGAIRDLAEGDGHAFNARAGEDGRYLVCKVPDINEETRDWYIDGRASNCGRPDDDEHRCWVRHGEPPDLHVDKNGNTCQAGAGSIATEGWHGFLHDGHLVAC